MKHLITAAALALSPGFVVAETITADVWVDNWFAFYSGETLIKEDSVSINTERSFNKESFKFKATRPFVLNFIVKDFKENDSGLEYIGSRKQQMGDGGLIAQFKDGHNKIIAVTDKNWKCMVTHAAPAKKSCAKSKNPVAGKGACAFTKTSEPKGWKSASYNASKWPAAVEYSKSAVRPKDGYDKVRWDKSAKFIWGSDLETDNTLLCKLTVN